LSNTVVLTANLAKTLGLVFLLDTRPTGQALEETSLDIACETAGVALGFGGLLLAGSYLYSKSCGGPRVAQITKLSCGELALLTVLFAERGGHKLRGLKKLLGATQASALDEAAEFLRANPDVLDALRSRPLELSAGKFALSSGVGFWSRWFKPKGGDGAAQSTSEDFDLRQLEAALASRGSGEKRVKVSATGSAKHDDLRDLVDEALTEVTREGV
jgi:hypothetical protein